MTKKTRDNVFTDGGTDMQDWGQKQVGAGGAGEVVAEKEAEESQTEEIEKSEEGKVDLTGGNKAAQTDLIGMSTADKTGVGLQQTQGVAKGSREVVRSSKQVNPNTLNNVIPGATDRMQDGRSVLTQYLALNKRPEAPDYDERRERALRWQRGIQLMGQLAGLIGDSRTGGRGGVTYVRDMGKQNDDYIANEIGKVRQAYADQVNQYIEADKLWRKGAYDAWAEDTKRQWEYAGKALPLAKDEHYGKDGNVWDNNGMWRRTNSGSGSRPRYPSMVVDGLTFTFQTESDKKDFVGAMQDVMLRDKSYVRETLKNYTSQINDPQLTDAMETGNLDQMLAALQPAMQRDKQLMNFVLDKNRILGYLISHAPEEAVQVASSWAMNWDGETLNNVLSGRRKRLNMEGYINHYVDALVDERIEEQGGGNTNKDRQAVENSVRADLSRMGIRLPPRSKMEQLSSEELADIYGNIRRQVDGDKHDGVYRDSDFWYTNGEEGTPTFTDRDATGGKERDAVQHSMNSISTVVDELEKRANIKKGSKPTQEQVNKIRDYVREKYKGIRAEDLTEIIRRWLDRY